MLLMIYLGIGYIHFLRFNKELKQKMSKSPDAEEFKSKPFMSLIARFFVLIFLWPLILLKVAE